MYIYSPLYFKLEFVNKRSLVTIRRKRFWLPFTDRITRYENLESVKVLKTRMYLFEYLFFHSKCFNDAEISEYETLASNKLSLFHIRSLLLLQFSEEYRILYCVLTDRNKKLLNGYVDKINNAIKNFENFDCDIIKDSFFYRFKFFLSDMYMIEVIGVILLLLFFLIYFTVPPFHEMLKGICDITILDFISSFSILIVCCVSSLIVNKYWMFK
jgi:hypothetical protein